MTTKRSLSVLALALIAAAGLAQSTSAFEPQDYSIFYYLSPAGQPTQLERQNPSEALEHGKYVFEVTDEKSPVRFPAGSPLQFVVRTTEPFEKARTTIQFLKFESQDGKRRAELKRRDFEKNRGNRELNIEKYGSSSLKLVPAQPLPPGEYCFSRTTITQGFCFGIDPASK